MEPRRKHRWVWAEEETALEFAFPIDGSIFPSDAKLLPEFQSIIGKPVGGVSDQIRQLVDGLDAKCFDEFRDLITSLSPDSIWTHWGNVWIRLEGDPPLFVSILQTTQLCEFPFNRHSDFAQFCTRFHGLFHSHPHCCARFHAPINSVTDGEYDPYFGFGLKGWEGSVPFYHDGSEIQVFLSPEGRVGIKYEADGMIDTGLTFGTFIEQYVSKILVSGNNESDWFETFC